MLVLPAAAGRALGGALAGNALVRRLGTTVVLASLLSGLALVGLLLRQADELRWPGDPLGGGVEILLSSGWGAAWWSAVAGASILLIGGALMAAGMRGGGVVCLLGLLPMLVFPGLIGHANAAEARGLALALDAVHVAAAGTWVGSLGVILLLGRGGIEHLVRAFSPIAMASVALLLASGALASWRMLDSVDALWTTGYGRTLSLKVGLFGVVALLGLLNWRRVTPRLGTTEGERTFLRSGTAEFLFAQVALLVTAVLVRMSPGAG